MTGRRQRIRALATSPALLLYAGSLARAGFAFLLGVVIARTFGPGDFGLFHAYTVLMTLTLCTLGEALDHGLIRHYTFRLQHDAVRAGDVIGSALAFRAALAGLVVLAGPGLVAAGAFGQGALAGLAGPGLIAGGLAALVTFVSALFLSEERFIARAVLLPALAAARFAVLGLAALTGAVAIGGLIWLDAAVIGGFALLSLLLVRARLAIARVSLATTALLARFSVWSISTTVPFVAYMGLGSPLLVYFHGPAAAGVFGVAVSLAVLFEHATAAFVSVLQREVSAIRQAEALRAFLRRATRRALLLALAVSPATLLGIWLIPVAFGPAFAPAQALFPIIVAGALLYMLTMPRALIFFALDRPGRLSVGAAAGFIAWLVAALALIPAYGALGAALALLAARALHAAALTVMVARAPLKGIAPGHRA